MPAVYGNTFWDLMAAEQRDQGMQQAASESSLNRLVSVFQNLRQTRMQKQQLDDHAKDAAIELAQKQQQLDLAKDQFHSQVTQADKALTEREKEHADQVKYWTDTLGLNKRQQDFNETQGGPATKFKETLDRNQESEAMQGIYDPKRYKPYVDKGLVNQESVDYWTAVSKQNIGNQVAVYNAAENDANLWNRYQDAANFKDAPVKIFDRGTWRLGDSDAKKAAQAEVQRLQPFFSTLTTLSKQKPIDFAARFTMIGDKLAPAMRKPAAIDYGSPAPAPVSGGALSVPNYGGNPDERTTGPADAYIEPSAPALAQTPAYQSAPAPVPWAGQPATMPPPLAPGQRPGPAVIDRAPAWATEGQVIYSPSRRSNAKVINGYLYPVQ